VLSPQAGISLHWSNRLLSEGRGLGLVCLIASQRPQKVHNDTLTSCETLVAMRVVHAADRAAVKDWIDGNGDADVGKEVLATLASLERGEAWVWSPEIGFGPSRVKFPMFQTFDSFAPPQLQKKVSTTGWADVDLAVVKEKLAKVIEEHKAKEALGKALAAPTPAARPATVSQPVVPVRPAVQRQPMTPRTTEGGALPSGERAILTACAQYPEGAARDQLTILTGYKRSTRDAYVQRLRERGYVEQAGDRITATQDGVDALGPEFEPLPTGDALRDHWLHRLPDGERKILDVLIQSYPNTVEREHLEESTGFKRSTRDAYIQRLSSRRLVDTVGRGEVKASDILFDEVTTCNR
jgi:hypothetical protein